MPQRFGQCTNIGNCVTADGEKKIEIPEGVDFICPECSKKLIDYTSGGFSNWIKIIVISLSMILIITALWLIADYNYDSLDNKYEDDIITELSSDDTIKNTDTTEQKEKLKGENPEEKMTEQESTSLIPKPQVRTKITYQKNANAIPLEGTPMNGASLKWYTSKKGGNSSNTPPTPKTNKVGTFYYYVSQKTARGESPREKITVIIKDNTAIPTTTPTTTHQTIYSEASLTTALNTIANNGWNKTIAKKVQQDFSSSNTVKQINTGKEFSIYTYMKNLELKSGQVQITSIQFTRDSKNKITNMKVTDTDKRN